MSRAHQHRQRATCLGSCDRRPEFGFEVTEVTDEVREASESTADSSLLGFIHKSWIERYRFDGFDLYERYASYGTLMAGRIRRLLVRSRVFLVHDDADHDHLFGYVVIEERPQAPVVHWCYVRETRRGHGLAGALVRHALAAVTGSSEPAEWHMSHPTKLGRDTVRRHGGKINVVAAWEAT